MISFSVSRVADVPLERGAPVGGPFWISLVVASLLVIAFPSIVLVLPASWADQRRPSYSVDNTVNDCAE